MTKRIKNSLQWIITVVLYCATATFAFAATDDQYGLKETAGTAGLTTTGTLQGYVGSIIHEALLLLGSLLFILLLYGGFIWMKARGNEKEVDKAKEIITSAIIGLIIIAAAYVVTSFVLTAVTR